MCRQHETLDCRKLHKKAHSNLNLRIAAVRLPDRLRSSNTAAKSFIFLLYFIISTSKAKTSCYFAVVFLCTGKCFTKIFFDLTTLGDVKIAFCDCNFSSSCLCDVTLSVYPHRAGLKNMPGHGWIRTYDLWNTSPMLCQLSYAVRSVRISDTSELSLVPSISV